MTTKMGHLFGIALMAAMGLAASAQATMSSPDSGAATGERAARLSSVDGQVQVIVEYNYVTQKDVLTPEGGNFSAVTPGLRFVTPSLNITAGVQFLTKDLPGFENDQRYIGTLSYQF